MAAQDIATRHRRTLFDMERSGLIKGGIIVLLIAGYVGVRVAQDNAAKPPQPDAQPTPAATPSASDATPEPAPTPGKMPKVTLPVTQLRKEEIKVGTGKEAKAGQRVTVNYRGMLTNGTVFDESYKRGQPFDFNLGAGEVIPGWDQGVAGMKEGGKRWLIIPSELGYGASGTPDGSIPPNAPLVFEVELLQVG
jgi:FKBP-type peptidyl-prolyl cis-trans isomerase